MQNFYSGTSGLVLPVKNKLEYPEEHRDKSRLHYYSTMFNTIEVNSIFYKLPRQQTIERWSNEVAGNFKFTFKLSKEVTHCKDLNFNKSDIKNFFQVIAIPKNKQGCILIQFPGKITSAYLPALKKLLTLISGFTNDTNWTLAVEFRHISWYTSSTINLLKTFNATCVIHDLRPFTAELLTETNIIYIRFHGTENNYRGSYTDVLLADYAIQIREWLNESRTVYAYFNNTLGPAAQNLITLNKFVSL
jgi:uncharacterized protein YecE (DUF72 family)